MGILGTWFVLTCKRYLKRPSFWVILLLLPAAAWMAGRAAAEENSGIKIAVYVEDAADNTLANEMAAALLAGNDENEAGMFSFYLSGNEQQLMDDVAARKAECGYVIGSDLAGKLDAGSFRRSIRVYSAPSTVLSELTTEVVFAALAQNYNRHLLRNYVESSELFSETGLSGDGSREDPGSQAELLYNKWLGNDSTFRFEAAYSGGQAADSRAENGSTVFPVRGLIAVYLFIIGIYSAVMIRDDWEKGIFLPLAYTYRHGCSLICLAAPVMLAGVSALAALGLGGVIEAPVFEVAAMLVYLTAICLFSWLLGRCLPNAQVLCVLIPFLAIGSLVFCPVFFDPGALIPAVKSVGRLFLPYYYLQAFR